MTNQRASSDGATDDVAADSESAQRQCVDCRILSPRTQTVHTLISSKHGWRIQRTRSAANGLAIEWRCPTCWQALKTRSSP